jgi:hypothetical protein
MWTKSCESIFCPYELIKILILRKVHISRWTISTNIKKSLENETKAADRIKIILCNEVFCPQTYFWDTPQNYIWQFKALYWLQKMFPFTLFEVRLWIIWKLLKLFFQNSSTLCCVAIDVFQIIIWSYFSLRSKVHKVLIFRSLPRSHICSLFPSFFVCSKEKS